MENLVTHVLYILFIWRHLLRTFKERFVNKQNGSKKMNGGQRGREKDRERGKGCMKEEYIAGCQGAHVCASVLAVRQATTAPTSLSP